MYTAVLVHMHMYFVVSVFETVFLECNVSHTFELVDKGASQLGHLLIL